MTITGRSLVDDARGDIRYAVRTLLRTPGFLVTVLSLGLAAGATTAVYGTVDWLLNRSPSGVVEPERLVGMMLTEEGREGDPTARFAFSVPQYEAMREIQDAFVDIAAYGKLLKIAGGEGWQESLVFQFVTGTYFPLLGVRPLIGRVIVPEDDVRGAPPAVVLSHALWQSRFGGSLDVLGAPIRLQGGEGRVVGVMSSDFEDYRLDWNAPTALWVPMRSGAATVGLEIMLTAPTTFFPIMGRLLPGVSSEVAHEKAQRWIEGLPPVRLGILEPNAIVVQPERELRISRREQARSFLGALLVVCFLILFAACFNVANFFLGRAAQRRREIALRSALGAEPARMLRQFITEATLVALATAISSVVVGTWVASLLASLPNIYLDLPVRATQITTAGALDGRMLAGAVALGVITSFVLALLPMLAAFGDPISAIKGSTTTWSWGRFRPTLRQGVLVLQIGLAVVLSVTAALYAQGFQRAIEMDPEYSEPATLLMARVEPADARREGFTQFYASLVDEIRSAPWAASVGLNYNLPYAGGSGTASLPDDPDGAFDIDGASAGPGLFRTFGVSLVAGREFEALDVGTDAVIINKTLADRLWPGGDPIGRQFQHTGRLSNVVGVVARERCRDLLAEPRGCAWRPLPADGGTRTVNIRTVGAAAAAIPQLRALVHEADPRMVIVGAQPLDSFLESRVRAERTAAAVSSGLALFGVVLLAIGCVSLFLSMVQDSLREIAIRMALGATSARVTVTIATHGLLVAVLGVVLGVAAALVVASRLGDQFFGVAATDLPTFIGVPSLILVVAMTSVGYSARAATRTDPAVYLGIE